MKICCKMDYDKYLRIYILYICVSKFGGAQILRPTLTSYPQRASDGEPIILSCSRTSDLLEVQWIRNLASIFKTKSGESYIYSLNANVNEYAQVSERFSGVNTSLTQHNVTLLINSTLDDGSAWDCSSGGVSGNSITIHVTGHTTGKIDRTSAKIDGTTGNVDRTTAKIDGTTDKMEGTTNKIDRTTDKIDGTTDTIDGATGNVDRTTVPSEVESPPNGRGKSKNESFNLSYIVTGSVVGVIVLSVIIAVVIFRRRQDNKFLRRNNIDKRESRVQSREGKDDSVMVDNVLYASYPENDDTAFPGHKYTDNANTAVMVDNVLYASNPENDDIVLQEHKHAAQSNTAVSGVQILRPTLTSHPERASDGEPVTLSCSRTTDMFEVQWFRNLASIFNTKPGESSIYPPNIYVNDYQQVSERISFVSTSFTQHNVTLRINSTLDVGSEWDCVSGGVVSNNITIHVVGQTTALTPAPIHLTAHPDSVANGDLLFLTCARNTRLTEVFWYRDSFLLFTTKTGHTSIIPDPVWPDGYRLVSDSISIRRNISHHQVILRINSTIDADSEWICGSDSTYSDSVAVHVVDSSTSATSVSFVVSESTGDPPEGLTEPPSGSFANRSPSYDRQAVPITVVSGVVAGMVMVGLILVIIVVYAKQRQRRHHQDAVVLDTHVYSTMSRDVNTDNINTQLNQYPVHEAHVSPVPRNSVRDEDTYYSTVAVADGDYEKPSLGDYENPPRH